MRNSGRLWVKKVWDQKNTTLEKIEKKEGKSQTKSRGKSEKVRKNWRHCEGLRVHRRRHSGNMKGLRTDRPTTSLSTAGLTGIGARDAYASKIVGLKVLPLECTEGVNSIFKYTPVYTRYWYTQMTE